MEKRPTYGAGKSSRGEVLVAIVNTTRDFEILASKLWYRVPVDSAPKRWPPEWMAFYLPKAFGKEAYAVRHFGKVSHIRKVRRTDLFPDEPQNPKSDREYYQVFLRSLDPLPNPIPSLRLRRIVFIATTMRKLLTATEINDLDDIPSYRPAPRGARSFNIAPNHRIPVHSQAGGWPPANRFSFYRRTCLTIGRTCRRRPIRETRGNLSGRRTSSKTVCQLPGHIAELHAKSRLSKSYYCKGIPTIECTAS